MIRLNSAMRSHAILWVLFLCQGFPLSTEFGLFDTEDLYKNGVDLGITSFEKTEVNETLRKTKKPWLIQFYSSWCGHCQRFAPTYKEFGIRVQGWTDVMGFGAINCAQEYNTQACRDFDVAGYPSLKLFAPNQAASSVGETIRAHDVPAIISEVTTWIETLEGNETTQLLTYTPDLTFFKSTNPMDVWITKNQNLQNAETAVLISCDDKLKPMINSLILDFYHSTKSSPEQIIIRKVSSGQNSTSNESNFGGAVKTENSLEQNIGLKKDSTLPFIVAIQRPKQVMGAKPLPESFNTKILKTAFDENVKFEDILATIIEYSKNRIMLHQSNGEQVVPQKTISSSPQSEQKEVLKAPNIKQVTDKDLIKKRRYTVYMSDLENALLYSLSHEVAQKKSIMGKAFDAFQHYLEVLLNLFPTNGTPGTTSFIQELYKWTNSHEDGILGEDLSAKIVELKLKFSSFNEGKDYIACKGSNPRYGNYPCAVWTLWHVLTVKQSEQPVGSDPRFVLSTMVEYMEQFFGCRDCAENFLKETEHGAAIDREVKTKQDSVLFLWKVHNKVNLRLKGDPTTDDPVYPKTIFPDETFCPQCFQAKNLYEETSNTWSVDKKEYNIIKTIKFLKDMYSNINMKNLDVSDEPGDNRRVNPRFSLNKNHQVAVIYPLLEKEKQNLQNASGSNLLASKGDVRLMFLVYGVSILLLIVVLIKVIKWRRNGRCLLSLLYPCQKYFIKNSPSKSKDYNNKFIV